MIDTTLPGPVAGAEDIDAIREFAATRSPYKPTTLAHKLFVSAVCDVAKAWIEEHPAALSGGDSGASLRPIVTYSSGCVFRDLNVPCRNPECKICHDLPSPSRADAVTEALREIDRRATIHPDDSHADLVRDMSHIRRHVRAALASAPEGKGGAS